MMPFSDCSNLIYVQSWRGFEFDSSLYSVCAISHNYFTNKNNNNSHILFMGKISCTHFLGKHKSGQSDLLGW